MRRLWRLPLLVLGIWTALAPAALRADTPAVPADAASALADANAPAGSSARAEADAKAPAADGWKSLEIRPDSQWVACQFGGDGPVEIGQGVISLGFGDPLTGVRWEGPFPELDYEISLQARRTSGFDFFCGLTLPAADQRFSLILGGWGGSLVGISSIDGQDAANNETMMIREFEQNRWYRVRMEVTKTHLRAWLDDQQIIDLERDERPLDIRGEMEQTTPVGIAAFQCQSEIRDVRVRPLNQRPTSKTNTPASDPTQRSTEG